MTEVAKAFKTKAPHEMWDSVFSIRHRLPNPFVGNEEFLALFDPVDRLYVLGVAGEEEIAVWFAAVINLAGFEEKDGPDWRHTVLLIRRRLMWVIPHPHQRGVEFKTIGFDPHDVLHDGRRHKYLQLLV